MVENLKYMVSNGYMRNYTFEFEQILQEEMITIIDEISPNWYKCYTYDDKKNHLTKIIESLKK